MPIYEYLCLECGHTTDVFQRVSNKVNEVLCKNCTSSAVTKIPSGFSTPQTDQQVMERHGAPGPGSGPETYRDPRQIGRWAESRFAEMGMEIPSETRKMIDAARDGHLPEQIDSL